MEFGDESLMIRYLLGELSGDEERQFEEHYFSDDRTFEELQIVESELIDAYVKGELPELTRQRFRTFYLNSPERRSRVENAKSLMAALDEISRRRRVAAVRTPVWDNIFTALRSISLPMRIAYATAAVAVLSFGFVTIIQNRSLRSEAERLRTEKVDLLKHNQGLKEQIADLTKSGRQVRNESEEVGKLQVPEALIAAILLNPGLSRALETGAHRELVIPRTALWVSLNLSLGADEYPKGYNAILENANGDEVERLDRLKSRVGSSGGRVIELQLPADSLPSDSYVVKLVGITKTGGTEEVDDYNFQVVRH